MVIVLSKTAEYALRAAACLAAAGDQALSADVLAERTKVPRRYLHRVLQDLAAADLLRSKPGPRGGYELARAADAITILDVVNAVSPLERIKACPLGLPSHTTLCPLHSEIDKACAATEKAFRGVTMRQLMESTGTVKPLCDVAASE
jgi:Rrf2 family protein